MPVLRVVLKPSLAAEEVVLIAELRDSHATTMAIANGKDAVAQLPPRPSS